MAPALDQERMREGPARRTTRTRTRNAYASRLPAALARLPAALVTGLFCSFGPRGSRRLNRTGI